MRLTVKMPRVAETVNEVVISELLVNEGDDIVTGQLLMRVETDKAMVEVPTPVEGQVVEVLVSVDQEVATGHPIIVIEQK